MESCQNRTPAAGRGDSTHRRPARVLIDVRDLEQISPLDTSDLSDVTATFAFRANDYYMGLVDWTDESDPIRRLIVPTVNELDATGLLDASDEAANTQMVGLQHKYSDTALMLVTDQCAGFCRYCFRKRLFLPGAREANREIRGSLDYIASHPEITDVLLTGGDPLTLPTHRIEAIVDALSVIPHVRTVRIGSKVPAFNPFRISEDASLMAMVKRHADQGLRIYFMCHFDHPRELTEPALAAIRSLQDAGGVCVNQCPVSIGINDDVDVLVELFQRCTEAGCPQYYAFQCRPTAGNSSFATSLVRGFELVAAARSRVSGLSRRARYCMSHASGKVEIVGVDDRYIFARYHRAKNPADENRMMVFHRDDEAGWLDDLVPVADFGLGAA
jgi:lysine 2,3-aminomutase